MGKEGEPSGRKTTAAASTQKAEAAPCRCGWTLTSTLFLSFFLLFFSHTHLKFVSSHHDHQQEQLHRHAAAVLLDSLSQRCTGQHRGNKGGGGEEKNRGEESRKQSLEVPGAHYLPDLQKTLISEKRESLTGL